MILPDTSVWIDHFRLAEPELVTHLQAGRILGHPWVIGEIALGSLKSRDHVLQNLDSLPMAPLATITEIRAMIEAHALYSKGIGLVDAGLLASCLLAPGTRLWTRDKRLAALSAQMGLAHAETQQ